MHRGGSVPLFAVALDVRHDAPVTSRLLDRDIRAALTRRLDMRNATVRHEMPLCLGTARIDVAVVGCRFEGFEIKSDGDSLSRLSAQAATYAQVLDRVTLVATARHLARAEAAVPDWWALWLVEESKSAPRLQCVRRGRANRQLDPLAIAQLLWRDEVLTTLRRFGHAAGSGRATRWALWSQLAAHLPLPALRAEVRATIRARPGW